MRTAARGAIYRAVGSPSRREPAPIAERSARILVVEDDAETRLALCDALADLGHRPLPRPDAEAALADLESEEFDLVLTDLRMPGMDGLELCRRLVADRPDIPVVVMTAFGDVDVAVGALRAGAFDFITKPIGLEQLDSAISEALDGFHGSPSVLRLEPLDATAGVADDLIGPSLAMAAVREQLSRIAATSSTVLITGESGTGKELAARAIHRGSERRNGPFVAMSCAAVPSEMLESELFGHVKGAFTGAAQTRPGLFRQAHRGTLFLDEIGDMSLELQPKLLRSLQERLIRPVGSSQELACDSRIVAATNRDLEHAVQSGRFRADLFFRLNVIHIQLPALRDRGAEDILALTRHFLDIAGSQQSLTAEAERLLTSYHWPGNVRELENTINASVALADSERIGYDDIPTAVRSRRRPGGSPKSEHASLDEVERRHIEMVLRAVGGNKVQAARKLGIDRATLYRKLGRPKPRS